MSMTYRRFYTQPCVFHKITFFTELFSQKEVKFFFAGSIMLIDANEALEKELQNALINVFTIVYK